MVAVGGQLHRRQGRGRRSCRRSASRSCATSLASIALLALLRWREGEIRLPRRDPADLAARRPRASGSTRSCGRSGCRPSRPATPRCSSRRPRCSPRSSPCSSAPTARPPTRAVGVLLSFLGVVAGHRCRRRHRADRLADRLRADPARRRCAGRPTRPSGRACCAGVSPLVLTTWATVGGHARPGADRARPAASAPGRARGDRASGRRCRRSSSRSPTPGSLAAALANVVVFDGVRLLGPTRDHDHPGARPGDGRRARVPLPRRADPARPRSSAAAIIIARRGADPAGAAEALGGGDVSGSEASGRRRAAGPAAATASRRSPSSSTTTARSP